MVYVTPGNPERPLESHEDEVGTWFAQQSFENPELALLTADRAAKIVFTLERFNAEEDVSASDTVDPEPGGLTPLAVEVQKLLMLFTNPDDSKRDTVDSVDVASFMIGWDARVDGDRTALINIIRQFTHDAHTFHIPWLQASIPEWDEDVKYWQKFWAVFGAMHSPQKAASGPLESHDTEIDTWFAQQSFWSPELARLTTERAAKIVLALERFTADQDLFGSNIVQLVPNKLTPLATETQKLLTLFTNPDDPGYDKVDSIDIASLMVQWETAADGDRPALISKVREFTRDAYTFYIPTLKQSTPSWDEDMMQWQKYWSVLGAMHSPQKVSPGLQTA